MKTEKFAVIDFEALNWVDLYAVGFYDGKNEDCYFSGPGDPKGNDNVVRHMFKILEKYKVDSTVKIYAHNGGRYDFLPIINFCNFNRIPYKIPLFINGRIVKLEVGKFKFIDSYPILPGSLEILARAYNIKHQKLSVTDDYKTQVSKEYLLHDIKGLYELLEIYKNRMTEYNLDRIPITVSSTAQKVFLKNYYPKQFEKLGAIDEKNIRQAVYGGRTEIFKMFYESENQEYDLNYYDVNSLYPSVMRSKEYPTGKLTTVKQFEPDLPGIYHIKFKTPDLYFPVLPYHSTTNKKLMFPIGEGEGWHSTPEIKLAITQGYDIKIYKGYVWNEQAAIFREYIDHFYNIKKNNKGPMKEFAKLMMNGLAGKFAQKRTQQNILNENQAAQLLEQHKVTWKDLDCISENPPMYSQDFYNSRSQNIQPHLFAFITAFARVEMYKHLLAANNIFYMDTDSIVTTTTMETSEELGEMKREEQIKQAYFVQPKVYLIDTKEHGIISRIKGFDYSTGNKNRDISTFKNAVNGDMTGFKTTLSKIMLFKQGAKKGNTFTTYTMAKELTSAYSKRNVLKDFNTAPIKI